ncbi:MAG: response regulator transcription factor, partial [Bacillota bacterium]
MQARKIVVIEDDISLRDNIEQLLEEFGYRVLSAEDGKKGIKIIKEILPDLIISDIMMPGIDGYEVLRQLGSDPKTLTIPFIFLTARAEMKDLREGMLLGADDYLIKPFN